MSLNELEDTLKSRTEAKDKFVKKLHVKPYRTKVTQLDDEPEFLSSQVDYSSEQKPTQINPSNFVKARKESDLTDCLSNYRYTPGKAVDIRDLNHGVATEYNHSIMHIMQNKYMRDSMERKAAIKLNQHDLGRSHTNFPQIGRYSSIGESSLSNQRNPFLKESSFYHKETVTNFD
jgi:hypothetical protein